MALTLAAPSTLESQNRIRFSVTGMLNAGGLVEGYNLATGAELNGGAALDAASLAMIQGLLARAGVALTGETAARVRSRLHARASSTSGTAGAVAMGPVCDLDIGGAGTEPVLWLGMGNNGGAGGDGAMTVDLEINHSIRQ